MQSYDALSCALAEPGRLSRLLFELASSRTADRSARSVLVAPPFLFSFWLGTPGLLGHIVRTYRRCRVLGFVIHFGPKFFDLLAEGVGR